MGAGTRITCHRAVLAAVAAFGVTASGARSQIIRFDAGSAQAGGGYEGVWRQLDAGGRFESQYYREWFELPFAGVLVNPGIFHYTLRLGPLFSQQSATGFDNSFTTRNVFVSFAGSLLQSGRTPISVAATRNAGSWRGGLAADRDFSESLAQASLWLNNRWLPVRLSVDRRSSRSTWFFTGDLPLRQDELARGFAATASNRKLVLRLEHRALSDRVLQRDYTTDTRSAMHTFSWGKGSRLVTSIESFSRGGFGEYGRFEWREQLRVQHTRTANSVVSYIARRAESGGSLVRERSWSAGSEAGPGWLRFSAAGNSSNMWFEGGSSTRQSFMPALAINLSLPLGAQLRASGFSGVERLSIEAEADGLIDVVDERHPVPELRSFPLDNRFIDAATVIVRSEDQSITYIAERDYQLIGAGSLLRVVVPVGSRIQAGDTVLVSYRYRLVGEGRESGRKSGYTVTLRVHGFTARRSEQKREVDADMEDGATGLSNAYDAVTAVAMDQNTPVGRFLLEASRAKRRGFGYADVTDELRASHAALIDNVIRTDVTASASRSRSGETRIQAVYGSGGIGTRISQNLGVTARVDAWRFHRDEMLVEGTVVGSLTVDWRFGAVETDWRFEHIRRENGATGDENRVSVRIVRRF